MTSHLHRCDLAKRVRLELRVLHGDELLESRLSRYAEAPRVLIADQGESAAARLVWAARL